MKAAEQILKQHKIAITGQRLAILNVFLNSHEPLSQESLRKQTGSVISRYTLYRSLRMFHKSGLVHILPSKDGTVRYILHLHSDVGDKQTCVHFICRKCGKTDFITGLAIPDIKKMSSHLVETIEVVLKGYCAGCLQMD